MKRLTFRQKLWLPPLASRTEAGRGFAVAAGDVRNLALRSPAALSALAGSFNLAAAPRRLALQP